MSAVRAPGGEAPRGGERPVIHRQGRHQGNGEGSLRATTRSRAWVRLVSKFLSARPRREGILPMRLRTRLAALTLLALGLSGSILPAADLPQAKPLSVLFLGDRGAHRPADRFEQLAPVLAGRGIELTYTEKVSDLNAETLGKYDALVIYANTTQISKDQEKALLDYVAGGGGFVPLHCASFCFLNSPEYIALVGAQFQKHGTGAVRDDGRRPRSPDHQGPRTVPHLGRDLRPHEAQHEGPPRPPDPRRPVGQRALDVGPHAGQGTRLLHGLWTRRPHLGPPRLPRSGRARHPLGREQGGRVRLAAPRDEGPQALRVREGRDPALHAGRPLGHAGRADPQDAEAALARRVASSIWPCPTGSRRSCSSPSRRSASRSP